MPFTLCMPKLSPTMTEGTIAKWHKAVGDFVASGELILEIATDKATIEHHLADPGWLRDILIEQGQRVAVGQPLAVLTADQHEPTAGYIPQPVVIESSVAAPPPSRPLVMSTTTISRGEQRIHASPLARKLAAQQGISLAGIKGSGPGGRIMSRDLERRTLPSVPQAPTFPIPEEGRFESITPLRQTIGTKLQYAKANIPHFYVSSTIEVGDLVKNREELKASGLHITVNDMLIKAISLALMEHPSLRCSFFPDRQQIFVHDHADIAVAVSMPGGIITPIVFHAEEKSLTAISQEMKMLAEKARAGKLQPQEYLGGACTLSNLGMYGIDEFIAILNPPHVAIVAVGAIVDAPVVQGGSVTAGKVMTLTVSGDHRVVDGTDAASFVKTMKELIQSPFELSK